MSIEDTFTWDEEAKIFKTNPVCYFCLEPISFHQAHTNVSICCEFCKAPIELFGVNPKDKNDLFYLWRNPNQSYCFFTGDKFEHISDFDWTSKRGNSLLNSSILDSSQKIYGTPSKKFRWEFLHTGTIPVASIFERFSRDEHLTSIGLLQGKLLTMSNVGNLYQIGIEHEYPQDRFVEQACSYSRNNFIKHVIPWTKGNRDFPESPLIFKDYVVQLGISNELQNSLIRVYKEGSEIPVFDIKGQFWKQPTLINSKDKSIQGFLVVSKKEDYGVSIPTHFSIYNFDGEEILKVGSVIERCAHPPIYDRENNCIVWVSMNGNISILKLTDIILDKSQTLPIDVTNKVEDIPLKIPKIEGRNIVFKRRGALFTAKYTADNDGSLEIVFVNQTSNIGEYTQTSVPYVLRIFHPLQRTKQTLQWESLFEEHEAFTHDNTPFTELSAAENHLQVNKSQNYLAFVNREKLLVCDTIKMVCQSIPLDNSMFDSPDSPIFTPAGLIYRDRTNLCLAYSQSMGWATDSPNDITSVNLPTTTSILREHARGIAVSGRHVYVAVNDTIHIYELHKINLG